MKIPFNNRYVKLGPDFYAKAEAASVAQPSLIMFNEPLAKALGIEFDASLADELANVFSGKEMPLGAEPLAMAYAGHQFGGFNPQLGDGRALLLGELESTAGKKLSIQLKGSGQTFFSRNGDGRSALGPVLREYLLSEVMDKLGVPTTRALACVATGEQVAREQLLPGGVITRVASGFIRVGSFQYFAAKQDLDSITKLADYVIETNYPACLKLDNPYIELLKCVVSAQAKLIAKWMSVGFIHGVMNTDNMSIAGETIDYGPCAFMDDYNHDQVFSSIDRDGRYAYNNQQSIGLWNLTRLAEALVPLFADDTDAAVEIAKTILQSYTGEYEEFWLQNMRAKIGLIQNDAISDQQDKELIDKLLDVMNEEQADFTLTFSALTRLDKEPDDKDNEFKALFENNDEIENWLTSWRMRLHLQAEDEPLRCANMRRVNPLYIPRNHQVEAAIRAAEDHNDFSVFYDLYEVLLQPFVEQENKEQYTLPPKQSEIVWKTFCGT